MTGTDTIAGQAQLFLTLIPAGAAFLAAYDVVRMIRRAIRHNAAAIAVEDLLFWMIYALWMFDFMYRRTEGALRGYLVLGAAAGMLLYALFLSRPVMRFGTALARGAAGRIGRFLALFSKND